MYCIISSSVASFLLLGGGPLNMYCIISSSVASFLLWGGGGGKTPKCTDRKKQSCIYNLYARASEASEHLRNICIFRYQNTFAYIYNQCSSMAL